MRPTGNRETKEISNLEHGIAPINSFGRVQFLECFCLKKKTLGWVELALQEKSLTTFYNVPVCFFF